MVLRKPSKSRSCGERSHLTLGRWPNIKYTSGMSRYMWTSAGAPGTSPESKPLRKDQRWARVFSYPSLWIYGRRAPRHSNFVHSIFLPQAVARWGPSVQTKRLPVFSVICQSTWASIICKHWHSTNAQAALHSLHILIRSLSPEIRWMLARICRRLEQLYLHCQSKLLLKVSNQDSARSTKTHKMELRILC